MLATAVQANAACLGILLALYFEATKEIRIAARKRATPKGNKNCSIYVPLKWKR